MKNTIVRTRSNHQAGFSLIELMVVVAIIGILAAVAVPNFTKFKNKAKQAEAKALLGSLRTAEKAFNVEWNSYTIDMKNAGFAVDKAAPTYTNTGFPAIASCTGYPATAPAEVAANATAIAASAYAAGAAQTTAATCAAATFKAISYGTLTTVDVWSIDQDGVIANPTVGL